MNVLCAGDGRIVRVVVATRKGKEKPNKKNRGKLPLFLAIYYYASSSYPPRCRFLHQISALLDQREQDAKMGRQRSIRSKAVHLVSDITTVILNPISDKPSKPSPAVPSCSKDENESDTSQLSSISDDEGSEASANGGPDTSSFTAFLASLLSSSESKDELEGEKPDPKSDSKPENSGKENSGRKSLLSRGKQSVGKAFGYAAKLGGFGRSQGSERKNSREPDKHDYEDGGADRFESTDKEDESLDSLPVVQLPQMSDSSLLLSERTRRFVYVSLPVLAKGRKWVLLYSTWRHGISLSTLYRRSMLCDGLSLLVVGDRKGAVFGGLVEAPLRPSKSRKYQGSNGTFLFTDMPGRPRIYHPTGANRYFTLCSPDFLALGGGNHFALYLDSDLLNGSSAASETYGNSCLAYSQDFAVKEVELWGFVYASKYEEMLAICRAEAPPGICRW